MTGRWPYPGDTPTERARMIANSLLKLLPDEDRPVLVAKAHRLGETWLGEREVTRELHDAIDGKEAAQLVGVSEDVIRQWACRKHPEDPDKNLLPRFKMRDGKRTYLVKDVIDASAAVRRTRAQRHDGPA